MPHEHTDSPLVDDAKALNHGIGAQLKHVRQRAGLSQQAASIKVFGTPTIQGMWSRWERGKERPNVGTLEKIARAVDVPLASCGGHDPGGGVSAEELAEARELIARALLLLKG